MHRSKSVTRLDIAGLLAHGSLRGTTPLYLTPSSATVENVVLVSQLEAIQRVRPNTVVVLSPGMGAGGWLVSAALRHSWERRASAVVVAGSTYSNAVIGLAERLGITLLASDDDPAGVALAMAAEIGAALSVVDAELARFARAVAKDISLGEVLKTISNELDGVGISVEYDGVILASAGIALREAAEVITVDIRRGNGAIRSTLTARVPASGVHNLQLVRSILEVASPSVKAAWLLGDFLEASRAVPTAALTGLDLHPGSSGSAFAVEHRHLLTQLGWRPDDKYVAMWIRGRAPHEPRSELTAVLRLLWRHAGRIAIKAGIGRAAHRATKRPPVQQGGTQLMKKAPVHRPARQFPMGPGIVKRQHRLRPVCVHCPVEPVLHHIQRLIPADPFKLATAPWSGAPQRMGQPPCAMHEFRVGTAHLVADDPGRIGVAG